jgi:hypothetical protein
VGDAVSCDLDSRNDGLMRTKRIDSNRRGEKQSDRQVGDYEKRRIEEKEKKRGREELQHVGGTIYGASRSASHLSFMCHNHDSIMTAH